MSLLRLGADNFQLLAAASRTRLSFLRPLVDLGLTLVNHDVQIGEELSFAARAQVGRGWPHLAAFNGTLPADLSVLCEVVGEPKAPIGEQRLGLADDRNDVVFVYGANVAYRFCIHVASRHGSFVLTGHEVIRTYPSLVAVARTTG